MNPVSLQRICRDNDLIRRMSLACMAGGLTVLSLPPFSWLIAVPVAFSALFLVLRNISTWRAFLVGWAFGVGQFVLGVSWIAESFYVDAERFGALALPAVAGLSAGLAVFPAIATVLFAIVVQRRPVGGIVASLLLASSWVAAEWLRGHVLTGFPWNLAGYALVDYASLRQPAAWIGSYGLSFLAVFVGTLPGAVFSSHPQRRPLILIMGGLIVVGTAGAGAIHLETGVRAPTGVDLRIVQGNVPQREKWSPGNRDATVDRYLELSSRPGSVDLLLWPETAFPGFLDEDAPARDRIATALPDGRLLLTGAPDRVESENGTSYFNTVQAYDGTGQILTGYAKHHLVPFGEYVPYRRWLPIARLTEGLGDFTPGPGPRTLALPGAPLVAVAICYEIIFPGHVVDRLFRPDWIFNATNDAWFGTSIGPEQHLASARMRAVEEGLPVIRAANTGISAVIDANGDVVARLDTGETGIIDASLPGARAPTLYARFGDWTLLVLIIACWALAWTGNVARRGPGAENSSVEEK
jgi:apolipoprotein N-acyltransferase